MIELRKDYILDRWSYIAADRGKRPQQFEKRENGCNSSACFFCPGNENLTPPEIGRLGDDKKWEVRWFPNMFPAVDENSNKDFSVSDPYHTGEGAFGYHEVIAETPDHNKQLADLSMEEIKKVLEVYVLRMNDLSVRNGIKYVQIFKNSGLEAGTSIVHSHSQIAATNIVPRLVKEKTDAAKKYKNCPYCDIIAEEEKSDRFIFSNRDFTVFAPFAPRSNYEAWIFPKKHFRNITELNAEELKNLAESFKIILSKLGKTNTPYNFFLHYSPAGENLHFHFEIIPRINIWAGFELATGSYVITVSPESAAEFYKE